MFRASWRLRSRHGPIPTLSRWSNAHADNGGGGPKTPYSPHNSRRTPISLHDVSRRIVISPSPAACILRIPSGHCDGMFLCRLVVPKTYSQVRRIIILLFAWTDLDFVSGKPATLVPYLHDLSAAGHDVGPQLWRGRQGVHVPLGRARKDLLGIVGCVGYICRRRKHEIKKMVVFHRRQVCAFSPLCQGDSV